RFFLHVLPKGFVRIRHFGLLSNRFRTQSLPLTRRLLARVGCDPLPLPTRSPSESTALWHCPRCGGPMGVARRLTAAELYLEASRFLMTTGPNPVCGPAPGMPSHACVQLRGYPAANSQSSTATTFPAISFMF
ncbi:transposase, partial [Edaphobacter aggregans]|uniref:transposase n=1 Tax=Edaphobacter aggregans TaxID=570835 RepID=UPI00316AD99D